jgi:hypothetical protein
MNNTGLFVFSRQENTSSNELYIRHDTDISHTGISFGLPHDIPVTRLSYQDGSGAILQSIDSLTLQSDTIKIPSLPLASVDNSFNFIVITNDGTLQRGSTYVSDIADSVTQLNVVNNLQQAHLTVHDTDISNLKLNVSTINTIISQIETNLVQIQLDLNTLTTTVLNDKKIQNQFNWLYGILLVLFIILVIIIIILFLTNRNSNKLISTMNKQLDAMSQNMTKLKKAMIELIKS